METNRTIQALLMSYSTDQLMVEDDLERIINDKNKPLNDRVFEVKRLLEKLTTIEQSVVKLQAMLQNNNNNDLKGNKAAGVRLRKGLQDIKAMAQVIRQDVSAKNKESK